MSSPETQVEPIDYAELVTPRLDAYGIAATGLAADAISNGYHHYFQAYKPVRQELMTDDTGELVLDEGQTVDVLTALLWSCKQKSQLAKQAYSEASKHLKTAHIWNQSKKIAETDKAIALGDQLTTLSERQKAVMMAVGVALVESTHMRLAAEQ
jgi:hypothetical protein